MAKTTMRSSWVLANGVRTHYTAAGDEGPAVVLCHGGGPGSSGYAGFRLMIPALAEHFRVYAVDQISYGQTDTRPHAWPVNAHQSLVDHVADFIDALCLDTVMISGNSQGAYVAAKYAIDHPERVDRMFLIGSGTICNAMGIPLPPSEGQKALAAYDGTAKAMRHFLETIIIDKSTITDDLVNARVKDANRPGVDASRKAFDAGRDRANKNPNLKQRFALKGKIDALTLPTRFIWGRLDTFAPMTMGQQLEKLLPNIPFSYIEGAGHQCQTDQPDVVNRMIIEHFKG